MKSLKIHLRDTQLRDVLDSINPYFLGNLYYCFTNKCNLFIYNASL